MGSLSRSQLLVYGAVAVALLLVGARWIRSADQPTPRGGVSFSSSSGLLRLGRRLLRRRPAGRRGRGRRRHRGGGPAGRLQAACRIARQRRRAARRRAPPRGPRSRGSTWPRGSATVSRSWCPQGPPARSAVTGASGGAADAGDGPISLGTATVEELDTIEGIGPVTAQNIVDFRDQHGGVSSVDQLDQINGIGPATMDALRARLQP